MPVTNTFKPDENGNYPAGVSQSLYDAVTRLGRDEAFQPPLMSASYYDAVTRPGRDEAFQPPLMSASYDNAVVAESGRNETPKSKARPSYYSALFRKQNNMDDRPMTRGDLEAFRRFLDEQAQTRIPRQLPSNPMDARVSDLADFASEEIRKFGDRTGLSRGFEYAMGETPRSIAKNMKNYWGEKYDQASDYLSPKVQKAITTAGDWVKNYGPDMSAVGEGLKNTAKKVYGKVKGTLKGAMDDLDTASSNIAKASGSKKQDSKG